VTATGHIVLAQVTDSCRDLDQSQCGGVLRAEGEDQDAAPNVAAEEGGRHRTDTGGPAAHVSWIEGAMRVKSCVLGDRYEAVKSVSALGASASRREVVTVEEEA